MKRGLGFSADSTAPLSGKLLVTTENALDCTISSSAAFFGNVDPTSGLADLLILLLAGLTEKPKALFTSARTLSRFLSCMRGESSVSIPAA